MNSMRQGEDSYFLLHYHEIALKKGNRPLFIRRLVENLKAALRDIPEAEVKALSGRVLLIVRNREQESLLQEIKERLGRIFGIVHFSPAYVGSLDMEKLQGKVLDTILFKRLKFNSFRISTKRGDKSFPLTSPEVNAIVGAFVKEKTGARVDLDAPELNVHLEIVPRQAFFYFEKFPGPGGLPVGVSGRVVCLISGGIDSPVAAYRVMKRGCQLIFVHFHSYPYLDKTTQEKVKKIIQLLTPYQYSSVTYFVPFGEIQREISAGIKPEYRVVLYRRMMLRIAETLALRERAKALVTGDSIGQVASQTLDNLGVIEDACTLPLLRPLIGMDKDEIVVEAKKLGTYETSIIPDQDCCQLFIPRHPVTRGRLEEVRTHESVLDVDGMVKRGLDGAERLAFSHP